LVGGLDGECRLGVSGAESQTVADQRRVEQGAGFLGVLAADVDRTDSHAFGDGVTLDAVEERQDAYRQQHQQQ
jgi:hypothetical protein